MALPTSGPPADDVVRTARLRLLPLPAAAHDALLAGARSLALGDVAPELAGEVPGGRVAVPPDWPAEGDRHVLRVFRGRVAADPSSAAWSLRALVDDRGRLVGHAGFHFPPAPRAAALQHPSFDGVRGATPKGAVEVGYTVFPAHRRRGLAAEALTGLCRFADARGVGTVIACVAPGNAASLAVLARVGGFPRVGRVVDDEDGPELVLRRDAAGG